MNKKKVQVYFEEKTIRRIKSVAKKKGTSAGGWVRQTVRQALENETNQK